MLPWNDPRDSQLGVVPGIAQPAPPPPPPPTGGEPDPMIGTTLGSFRIVKVIGKGGMGTVYLGEQTVIGSKVAIKILHPHLASNSSLVSRFYSEARAVNLIGHENIVSIFDMNVVAPNRYYLIMELLEGVPLSEKIRGPMAAADVIPILSQVCDALDAAHEHGVIHRDLKPENIFLIKRGRKENFAKLLDFGIAKLFAESSNGEQTGAGMIVGTPEYMAPEQATGETIDGRADVYATGVIAYLMLTGRLPFSGGGLTGLLLAHRDKIAASPQTINPEVPKILSDAVMKALAKKPEDRFQTAGAFGLALEMALTSRERGSTPMPFMAAARPAQPIFKPVTPPFSIPRPEELKAPAFSAPPPSVAPVIASVNVPTPNLGAPALSFSATVPAPPTNKPPSGQHMAVPGPPTNKPPSGQHMAVPGTPQPVHPRHATSFDARVILADGTNLGTLPCQDISRGGAFLCTDQTGPALFTRVRLIFPVAGDLECVGEVVRHVSPDQASAWGMKPGFGVQFTALSAAQKDALARLTQGLPAHQPPAPPKELADDPSAEAVLVHYRKRINGDHYVMLALMADADLAQIRSRAREARRELDTVMERPLSAPQREQARTALDRLKLATDCLTTASTRAEYDANRANWKGVARSIAAGLTVTEIEALRRDFCLKHPGHETQAQLKFVAGNAFEAQASLPPALELYEEALALDPLNLRFQQRYWGLKRK